MRGVSANSIAFVVICRPQIDQKRKKDIRITTTSELIRNGSNGRTLSKSVCPCRLRTDAPASSTARRGFLLICAAARPHHPARSSSRAAARYQGLGPDNRSSTACGSGGGSGSCNQGSSSAVRPSHPWPPPDRDPPARSFRHPHRAGPRTRPDQASPPPARWAAKQHLHDGLRLTRPGGTASAGTPRGVGLPAPAAPVHADQRHFSAVAAAAPDADLAGRHGLIWGKISVKKSCREGRSDPVRSLTSSWFVWAALRLAFFFIR